MPSSLFRVGTALTALSSTAFATKYKVQDTYEGDSFLDGFDFFTATDPTNGFVQYLDQSTAANKDMLKLVGDDNYIGVDYETTLAVSDGIGRSSVRIESKTSYTQGLFIVDLKHMPGGACGSWPAFWSLGSGTWPVNGEIDIIEGVNQNTVNKMVLHTDTACSVDGVNQTDAQNLYNCALDSSSGTSGCDVNAVEANTYGTGFNDNNGGVYAMEWTADFIKLWFFPRGSIPASITADKPDTSKFGTPNANFQGACEIDKKFVDHKFIFDTTFCGDWAGNVYGTSGCPAYTGLSGYDSCKKYVAENPSAFEDTFWQISYFKTYEKTAETSSSSSSSMSSTKTSSSSSTKTSSMSSTKTSSTSSTKSPSVSSTKTSSRRSTSTESSSSKSTSAHVSTTSSSFSSSVSSTKTSSRHSISTKISSSKSTSVHSSTASSVTSSSYASSLPYPSSDSTTPAYPTGTGYAGYSESDSYPDTTTAVYEAYSSSTADYQSSSADSYGYGDYSSSDDYDSYPTTTATASDYDSYEASSTATYGDYEASETSPAYGAYESSASGYGDYDASETSSTYGAYEPSASGYSDNDDSKTGGYVTYPTTGAPYPTKSAGAYSYGDDSYVTTVYTTTYVDVCETGYTTIATTYTAVYAKPTSVPSYEDKEECPPGFTTTAKYCATGCGNKPTTVTLTVPVTATFAANGSYATGSYDEAYPTSSGASYEQYSDESASSSADEAYPTVSAAPYKHYSQESGSHTASAGSDSYEEVYPTGSSSDSYYEHYTAESYAASASSTPSVYVTKVLTLSIIPVPASEYYAASASSDGYNGTYASAKPYQQQPSAKYTPGGSYTMANMTFAYGTGTGTGSGSATKTQYDVPEFTGAASSVRAGGIVTIVAIAVAAMLM